jgi:G6PDH family F420-dependent oxidoreductase
VDPGQGNSPFVWAVLGGIAQATRALRVGTGVPAPILRLHPAVVAHAAASVAAMMPRRFFLGVGTGERLNEHVIGGRWPTAPERREMLAEAVEVIRRLFTDEEVNQRGRHFRVEHAQLYTLPPQPPPILLAVAGRRSAQLAARICDGMIGITAEAGLVDAFEAAGGRGKPQIGQLHMCWADSEEAARKTALQWWPNGAIGGGAVTELARPTDFAELAALVNEQTIARTVVVGPDPRRTSTRSRGSPPPGSLRCTCTRWARTRTASCAPTPTRSSPCSPPRPVQPPPVPPEPGDWSEGQDLVPVGQQPADTRVPAVVLHELDVGVVQALLRVERGRAVPARAGDGVRDRRVQLVVLVLLVGEHPGPLRARAVEDHLHVVAGLLELLGGDQGIHHPPEVSVGLGVGKDHDRGLHASHLLSVAVIGAQFPYPFGLVPFVHVPAQPDQRGLVECRRPDRVR